MAGGQLPFGLAPSGDLTSYTPTLREKAADWLRQKMFTDNRAGQDKATRLVNWGETMLPPFGFATSMYDAGNQAGRGNYGAAALTAGMAAIPEVKIPSSEKKYVYSTLYRPPAHSTVPSGFLDFGPATAEHKFGTVSYSKPLSSRELADFELQPLDPNHPENIKKSFHEFQGRFVDDFSNAGETYQSPKGDFIITPHINGDGWQVTHFTPQGEASGHDVITDFDELARYVWSAQRDRGK